MYLHVVSAGYRRRKVFIWLLRHCWGARTNENSSALLDWGSNPAGLEPGEICRSIAHAATSPFWMLKIQKSKCSSHERLLKSDSSSCNHLQLQKKTCCDSKCSSHCCHCCSTDTNSWHANDSNAIIQCIGSTKLKNSVLLQSLAAFWGVIPKIPCIHWTERILPVSDIRNSAWAALISSTLHILRSKHCEFLFRRPQIAWTCQEFLHAPLRQNQHIH